MTVVKQKTNPLPLYTKAVLLKDLQRGFYAVEKLNLIPSPLSPKFIAALPATPDMTALARKQLVIKADEVIIDTFLDEPA